MDSIQTQVAEGRIVTWAGEIRVTTSAAGVCEVMLPYWTDDTQPIASDDTVVIGRSGSKTAERHLRQALAELAGYFAGERREFTVPLDLTGPEFQRRVWREVARVPFGETRSYGEIARILGAPQAFRAVGAANGANPVAPFVPCHRIVGSNGHLTGYGPGLPLKQRLLVMENAMPASPAGYTIWTERVSQRLGTDSWVIGARSTGIYCRPSCSAARRSRPAPNPVFATRAEAEAQGYRACRLCLAA